VRTRLILLLLFFFFFVQANVGWLREFIQSNELPRQNKIVVLFVLAPLPLEMNEGDNGEQLGQIKEKTFIIQ